MYTQSCPLGYFHPEFLGRYDHYKFWKIAYIFRLDFIKMYDRGKSPKFCVPSRHNLGRRDARGDIWQHCVCMWHSELII